MKSRPSSRAQERPARPPPTMTVRAPRGIGPALPRNPTMFVGGGATVMLACPPGMSETLSSLEHLVRRHPAGTVLFREGDAGRTMYVIRPGKGTIRNHISRSGVTLPLLGP